MKKFWTSVVALTMVLSLAGPMGAAALQTPAPAPAPAPMFEGELLNIDATAKWITVKGAGDREMKFTFTDRTQIVGATDGVQGLATKKGTRVKVQYTTQGENHTATRIEVSNS